MDVERIRDMEKEVIKQGGEIRNLDIRVTNLENLSLKLENTILKEGQETRAILRQVIQHTQNMEKIKMNLWVKMLGAGGLIYIVIQEGIKYLK